MHQSKNNIFETSFSTDSKLRSGQYQRLIASSAHCISLWSSWTFNTNYGHLYMSRRQFTCHNDGFLKLTVNFVIKQDWSLFQGLLARWFIALASYAGQKSKLSGKRHYYFVPTNKKFMRFYDFMTVNRMSQLKSAESDWFFTHVNLKLQHCYLRSVSTTISLPTVDFALPGAHTNQRYFSQSEYFVRE